MGVEQLRDGSIIMLLLDPSHSPAQMSKFNSQSNTASAMRLVRVSTAAMKAKQYQIVAVISLMETESQYQVIKNLDLITLFFMLFKIINIFFQLSKIIRSLRIPQER